MKKLFLLLLFLGLVSSGLYPMENNQSGDPIFQGNISEETTENYESDSENDPVDEDLWNPEMDAFMDVIFGENRSGEEDTENGVN